MRGIYKTLLMMSILVYLGYGIFLFVQQDSIIYLPQYAKGSLIECAKAADLVAVEDDAVRGLLYPKSTSSLIVIFHGNATNACERDLYPIALYNNPASVLVVSYPGYMGDTAKANNKNILNQVETTVKWAKAHQYTITGIIGESIGAGPASYFASLSPAPLALIGPFPSLSALAQNMFWMYPGKLLIRNDFNVTKWASSAPKVLIFTGGKDETIPKKYGEDLFTALPQQTKYLKNYDAYDHTALINSGAVAQEIADFLK